LGASWEAPSPIDPIDPIVVATGGSFQRRRSPSDAVAAWGPTYEISRNGTPQAVLILASAVVVDVVTHDKHD
jgi:hypothetical protein